MERWTSPIEQRATVFAALGDPHRVAVWDALALSDRTPTELGELLGIRSNLLAHHMQVLTKAGLVESRVSSGDRRRRYFRIRVGTTGLLAQTPMLAVSALLFVCTRNSARSQLAAALWRERSGIPAASAGTHPAAVVHPGAVQAAARHRLSLRATTPQAIAAVRESPDLLVTVCDEANEELDAFPGVPRLHWSLPDPVAAGTNEAFDRTIDQLTTRIDLLKDSVEPRHAA